MPILQTKLRRPIASSFHVARPRLLEQLTASVQCPLILVSAPAGYGKTALVSRWLDATDSVHAWLSLDEHDDDVAAFLLHLLAAVRTVYPGAMETIEPLLRAPALVTPSRLADALLHDLAALPGPLILALDDYHSLKTPEIHLLMTRLAEHLPAHVHLLLITRSDPPLPIARLRGRRQLGEVRAADLRFSVEEARLLLQHALGAGVTEEVANLLENSTEGWAVGLHLAALSLRNQADFAASAQRIAQHGHQSITEYLLSEVLAGLTDVQRDCLLRTALLDRFCAALVDAVLPRDGLVPDGDDCVRSIQRSNLFVVALDDDGTWLRYHHFFQSLLRVQASRHFAAAELKTIHARASDWFAAQGLVDEAVIYALRAGDPAGAARLVEAQIHPALDREDWRAIEHWIKLLPPDVHQRPRLLTAQAWLHVLRYQFAATATLLDTAEAAIIAEPELVRGAEEVVQGEINVLRAMMAHYDGDFDRSKTLSKAALDTLRPDTMYATGQASLYHIWGLQGSGEYGRAIEFAHQQIDAYGLRANALTLRVLLVLVNTYYEMADLPHMQESTLVFQELARQSGLGASRAWVHFMHGWICYQRNELVEAEQHFRRLAEMSPAAHAKALVDGHVGLALTCLAQARPGEAAATITALRRKLLERNMLTLTCVADSLEQRVALAVTPESCLDWSAAAHCATIPIDFWEQPILTHVRTLLAAGTAQDLAKATELLEESRAKSLSRNLNRNLIEAGGLQALVLAAQGQADAALVALQDAVERATPGGALRLLVDCGPGLIGLLRKLPVAGAAQKYVHKVLAAYAGPRATSAVPASPPAMAPLIGTLTNREIDILVLLAERLADKDIAERLVLSPLTVKKYTQRIYRKLGVHDRRAAVAAARRLGMI